MPVDTKLHKAANQGDKDAITDILAAGDIDVNAEGAANRTALHRCCGGNHEACAILLLSKKANINALDKSGRSPLHWACIGGHAACAKLLLNYSDGECCKVNVQTKAGMTATSSACESGKIEVLKELVAYHKTAGAAGKEEVDFKMLDGDGKDCIQLAKDNKHKELLQLLVAEKIAPEGSAACVIS